MLTVELPDGEIQRLKTLCQYHVLDTAPEAYFDDLTRLAAYICQTPIAAIGLTDAKRQWFKSKIGFASSEEPRGLTFCAHAILHSDLLIVPDTLQDQRFETNPFAVGEAHIRFYAGAPLLNPEGYALGTLCVLDHVPRKLSAEQQQALRILANQVVTQLELRRNLEVLEQNIAERRRSEAQLRHNAFHDQLTGLPNRALFMHRLRAALEKAQRYPKAQDAVLFIDLDRFKLINDSLGHLVGDQLLVNIAHRLKGCLRPTDTVARLGGDEFAILLPRIQTCNDATEIAERIQAALKQPFRLGSQEVFTSTSVGIALSRAGFQRAEDLLRDADTAMYRAKALGRDRYQVFDRAMHDSLVTLLQLETDLRRAVEDLPASGGEASEFEVYYQPIVRLTTGKISGFEALVRWQHPLRGLLNPTEFIAIAEDSGAIVPLSYWVLQQACQQLRTWQASYSPTPLTISVNLSSKLFAQPDLIQQICWVLKETGQSGHRLRLEVTESAIMENAELAVATILQLKALGIGLHLDDFGTGYSSLNYLQRFPVDVLKIDQSFINKMEICTQEAPSVCAPIVQTILTLARHLNLEVTAEGVETQAQLIQLKAWKCQYAQGYFFAHPLKAAAATALIAQDPSWVV
jgi:diguanylate cyclase (GGDEF)-like protein